MATTSSVSTLLVLLLAAGLGSSCAKKLPEQESRDMRENVLPVSLFDSSVTIKIDDEEPKALADESEDTLAINEKGTSNVEVVSGDTQLRPFFRDLKIERFAPGEELKVSFKLTRNFLVAYAEVNDQEKLSAAAREIQNDERKIALFQYPVDAYGIKRRIINGLGEETRDLEFVSTNKAEANFIRITAITSQRKLSGLLGLSEDDQQKVVLKNRLERRAWNPRQLRRLFKNNDILKVSAHGQQTIGSDANFIIKSYPEELYLYRAIGRNDLNDHEQIANRFGFVIRAFRACDERDAALAARPIEDCFLRSEFKSASAHVRLKAKKDEDNQSIAESEISQDLAPGTGRLIQIKDGQLSDTVLELTRQVPTRANRFLFAVEEVKNNTKIQLTTTREVKAAGATPRALDQQARYQVDYKGPAILKDFFADLEIEATRSGEVFDVKLDITPNYLTAAYKRQGKEIATYLKEISSQNSVPLFQFRIHNFGTIERVRNQTNEDVDLEFKNATFSTGTHVIVPNTASDRQMAGLRGLDLNQTDDIYLREQLNNSIMTFSAAKGIFGLQNGHELSDNELVQLNVTDRRLILSHFKNKSNLNAFERQALPLAGATPLLANCSRQAAGRVNIPQDQCVVVAIYAIDAQNIAQTLEQDEQGHALVSARTQSLRVNVSSVLMDIESNQSLNEFSIKSVLKDDILTTLTKEQLHNVTMTLEQLNQLLPNNEQFFGGLFQRHIVQTTLLGRTLYILRPMTLSELGQLERGMVGRDPRYVTCTQEQASAAQLSQDDCVMSAAYSLDVNLFGLKTVTRDGADAATVLPDYSVAADRAVLLEVSPRSAFRRFDFGRNLRLQDSVVLNKTESFDMDEEYLYLPSTHDTPKDVVAADPFFQGNEKIVKLKFSEEGLNVHEVIEDPRFRENTLNSSPVLTIRGRHIDFTCAQDRQGTCTDEIVQDSQEEWNKRNFFQPNLDQIDVQEVNTLNLFTVSDSCIYPVDAKMTHYEIKKGVINIEVERTFRVNEQSRCVVRLFYSDNLSSASFKVKYFYSLVRLKDLATANYEKVAYPIQEQDDFGFFKTEKSVLNNTFDDARSQQVTWINRFNPKKGDVVYRLSKSFDRPENAHIKEATYKVVDNINVSLRKANAGIQLKLEAPSEFHAGDLRNNSIVLIDDPLANGLLGYGPSVANPRTGEIVQAHTNMYGGVLKTLSRHVYQSMVDLSYKQLAQSKIDDSTPAPTPAVDDVASADAHGHAGHSHARTERLNGMLKSVARARIANADSKTRRVKVLEEQRLKHKEDQRHIISDIDFMHSLGRSNGRDAITNGNVRELLGARSSKDLLAGKNGYDQMLERYAKNNAYHKDFLLSGNLGKTYIKGILDIAGVKNENGTLKNWEELSLAQQEEASKLIVTHAYTTTLTHELGHNLGLRHNFIGSADKDNFYTQEEMRAFGRENIPAYSSIMDYGFSELNELPVMGKYDVAALRYAYARQVETETGDLLAIPSTLTEMKEAQPDLKLKKYEFCTDENAGLSVKCNRFDEGTSITEIAQHYIDKYKDFYKYRNFRDNRNDFSQLDVGQYVWARTSEFRRMRVILEDYEFFASIFGKDVMASGCNATMTARYPICKEINDRVAAAKLIGNFFIEVINTPDRLCALVSKDEPTKIKELRPLAKIYNDIKFNIDKKIITSCFEPEVNEGLKEDNLIVVAEGGKSVTSYKGTDSRYRYKTDIDVLGVWPDKILAMKTLFTRLSNVGSTEDGLMSFMDIPEVAEKVEDFLGHIVLDRPLENKLPFVTADGQEVEIDYKLNLDNYIIPEQAHWYPIVAFSLPFTGSSQLNKIMLKAAARETMTSDPEYRESAESTKASLSVYRTPINERLSDEHIKTMRLEQYLYGAADNNVLAGNMIGAIDALAFLKTQPRATVIDVFTKRARPAVPTDLSEAEKLAFTVPDGLLNQLVTLLEQGVTLEREVVVGQFGEELGNAIMAAVGLGADGIKRLIQIKLALRNAPADATPEVKRLYGIELETLQLFLTNKLEAKTQFYRQSIPLLPAMNDNPVDELMELISSQM